MKFRVGTLLLFIGLSLGVNAHDFHPDLRSWNKTAVIQAKICAFSFSKTKQERDVIYYSNLARLEGKLFVKTILMPYLQSKGDTDLSNPYISLHL